MHFNTLLPKGPIREGQFLLSHAKLNKALRQLDIAAFTTALTETVAQFAFAAQQGSRKKSFNIENVTYGSFPAPAAEAIKALSELANQQILSFSASCIITGNVGTQDAFVAELNNQSGFVCSDELVACLLCNGSATDYYTSCARLLFANRKAIEGGLFLSPTQVLETTYKALQTAKQAGHLRHLSDLTLEWFRERWAAIWERQRFLLRQPSLYEKEVDAAWERNEPNSSAKILGILIVIRPMLGISNQDEVKTSLEEMLQRCVKHKLPSHLKPRMTPKHICHHKCPAGTRTTTH